METNFTKKELEILDLLEIHNNQELLQYYPYRYELNHPKPFSEWQIDETVIFEGKLIDRIRTVRYPRGAVSRFQLESKDQVFEITIYNRNWINRIKVGTILLIIGKYTGQQKVTAMQYYSSNFNEIYGIQPVYHLKEGFTLRQLRKMLGKVLQNIDSYCKDDLPSYLQEKYKLLSLKDALLQIHNPQNEQQLKQALRRLKYEEFFWFQIAILHRRSVFVEEKGSEKKVFRNEDIQSLLLELPFTLTAGQKQVSSEILSDLKSTFTMNRLLQGDVGSGKTIVAIIAIYANHRAGYQSAMMVPTEILAKQQYQSVMKLLSSRGVSCALLCASISTEERNQVYQGLKSGTISVVVGTHALIQETVEFHRLGLVVTDEQHRFGVNQRQKLKQKGQFVDYLMMSATPIPRTLANSYYGDMQISSIQEKPEGRLPIITEILNNSLFTVFHFIVERLRKGERCYIICASIEESETLQLRSVLSIFEALQREITKKYQDEFTVGLLHGRMTTEERDQVMDDFQNGHCQILVSTTVIEVGVDVKEATTMAIYDADRFGLSQLHQLRGRIGRNQLQSYCYLLTDSKQDEVMKRLAVLKESNDGFHIAEMDLLIRGPGDILGTRQSGLPMFILADLIKDENILEAAREDAKEVLQNKDFLENKKYLSIINDKIDTTIV